MIHSSTLMRMSASAESATPSRAKDITQHHMPGIGFDPVASLDAVQRLRGRLRRTRGTDPESQFNPDETARWMDVQQAARLLEIAPDALSTLRRHTVESRWREVYMARPAGQSREEALIAAEVLLDYVDSALQMTRSRAYYRARMEQARAEVEGELQARGHRMRWLPMYGLAWAMLGMSAVVVVLAVIKANVRRSDFMAVGERVSDYMTLTFMKSTNLEPAPDYSTRYMLTPTAQELAQRSSARAEDSRAGLVGKDNSSNSSSSDALFRDGHGARLLEQKCAYEEAENAEMVKLWNEESAAAAARERAERLERSRVTTFTTASTSSAMQSCAPSQAAAETMSSRGSCHEGSVKGTTGLPEWSLRDFLALMENNFGGGSRFQRITNDTTARAREMRAMEERTAKWMAEESSQR